jgi:hypothetical protein
LENEELYNLNNAINDEFLKRIEEWCDEKLTAEEQVNTLKRAIIRLNKKNKNT